MLVTTMMMMVRIIDDELDTIQYHILYANEESSRKRK